MEGFRRILQLVDLTERNRSILYGVVATSTTNQEYNALLSLSRALFRDRTLRPKRGIKVRRAQLAHSPSVMDVNSRHLSLETRAA